MHFSMHFGCFSHINPTSKSTVLEAVSPILRLSAPNPFLEVQGKYTDSHST